MESQVSLLGFRFGYQESDYEGETDIQEMETFIPSDIKLPLNKKVMVTGMLEHAETAWHKTRVMLTVTQTLPSSVKVFTGRTKS
jgi:Domain of unknown function (DUF4431)